LLFSHSGAIIIAVLLANLTATIAGLYFHFDALSLDPKTVASVPTPFADSGLHSLGF
jgi:hypothetical protein